MYHLWLGPVDSWSWNPPKKCMAKWMIIRMRWSSSCVEILWDGMLRYVYRYVKMIITYHIYKNICMLSHLSMLPVAICVISPNLRKKVCFRDVATPGLCLCQWGKNWICWSFHIFVDDHLQHWSLGMGMEMWNKKWRLNYAKPMVDLLLFDFYLFLPHEFFFEIQQDSKTWIRESLDF